MTSLRIVDTCLPEPEVDSYAMTYAEFFAALVRDHEPPWWRVQGTQVWSCAADDDPLDCDDP